MVPTGQDVVDGKYRIVRELGKGGMGAVYEAQHLGTGRRVAVKVIVSAALAKESDILVRFQREARASGSIDSQHVVQVLDTGIDPATQSPYMVMELLAGEDVHELVHRLGPLPPDLVLRIVAQACLGLQAAHDQGIVHRDIKSANVFLARREGGQRVLKLLDFGIAKVRAEQLAAGDNHLTRTGAMLGSPLYMSPEQARGAKTLDGRSDIFSLGVMMYEALSGITPYGRCETLGELILAICGEAPEPLQDRAAWVPREVAALVHKALAQDPARRFQSAGAMHAAVAELLPQGFAITEAMLVGVSSTMRESVALRLGVTPAGASGPPVSEYASTLKVGTPPAATPARAISSPASGSFVSTDGGVADTSGASRSSRSAARWLFPLGAVVLLGGAAAGIAARPWQPKPSRATEPPSAPTASSVTEAPSSAPREEATTAPSAGVRSVHVSISAPPEAQVEVDGRPVTVVAGKIEVRGELGSAHPVRIALGARETRAEVAVAQIGAVPDRLELAAAKVGGVSRPSASAASSGGKEPPGASGKPPSPAVPSGAPTINRNF